MASKKEIRENGFEGYESFKKLLSDRDAWELRDSAEMQYLALNAAGLTLVVFPDYLNMQVSRMSNEEIRQAIIENILVVSMWEKIFEEKASYTLDELVCYVFPFNHTRVQAQFHSSDVQNLLEKGSKELRIKPSMLEAAMEYCGVFYHGYGPLTKV